MRSTLGVVLAIVAAFITWTDVPAPPSIAVQTPTPESVRAEFQREQKQKQYDNAQAVIVRFARSHKVKHVCLDVTEALAHAAVDFPVLRNERANAKLYAALAFYESGFRPDAFSGSSIGVLQINPKAHDKYSVKQLLDPYINASYGASILAGYSHGRGLFQGLHRYNGLGPKSSPTDDSYAVAVFNLAGFAIPEDAVYGT